MAARRSPARFLAPIALLAFAFALYTVVNDAREPAGTSSSSTPAQSSPSGAKKQAAKKKSAKRRRKAYVVKTGDTPSGIAEKTGVSLATLQKLNPDLDPQALSPGQRIRLTRGGPRARRCGRRCSCFSPRGRPGRRRPRRARPR